MDEHEIRHLPVTEDGGLIGVVSDRDARRIWSEADGDEERDKLTVKDAFVEDSYIVDLSAPADVVLNEMAQRHVDVAVVVKDGRLAGIFTMTDAFRGFAELLRTQFPNPAGGDEAA